MRFTLGQKWSEIATALNRTVAAVQGHYHQVKITHHSSFEDWTPEMDHRIIDGRRRGFSSKQIGLEMYLPSEAIQGRWSELQKRKQVPEDVLALWRRKGEVIWSEREDEHILKVWMELKSDDELVKQVHLEGKQRCDIRERRVQLCSEMGPVYRRLMGIVGQKEDDLVRGTLKMALGGKKYAWMH
jgi:hypothetical protein